MNSLRWVCGPDGRVYLSDDFDAYRIVVYDPGSSVEHVIERPYEHRQRTPEEIEEHTPHIVFRHRGGGTQTPESHGSKTDRDIISLHPRTDGTLWVLSSRGALDAADGVSFDVFDARGRFEQQVTVAGDASYPEDDLHFVGTRLIVVENSRSALRAYQGGDDEELSDEELENAEPVSLSCYDIGLTRRAAGGSR
jgi:hypothetical protein